MMEPTTSTEQKLYGTAPYFIVADIFQSAEFYRDKLGFQFDRIWGEPPQFVMVRRDGVVIMLKSVGSPGHSRPNHWVNPDAYWDAYIGVKDASALYEELRARGVKITREIEDTPYGCRDFDVEDNSGYILCFGQDLETKEVARAKKVVPMVPPPEVDARVLQSHVGKYKSEDGLEVNVIVKDGQLFAVLAGQQPLSLMAVGETTFKPTAFDGATVTFKVEAGKTMSLAYEQGANTTLLKRVEETRR